MWNCEKKANFIFRRSLKPRGTSGPGVGLPTICLESDTNYIAHDNASTRH